MFMVFLGRMKRLWRLAGYTFFCLIHVFISLVVLALSFIDRNLASGERVESFFTVLQKQLAAGNCRPEFLPLPGYLPGILLTLISAAAIIGGAVLVWRNIRWYSRPLLLLAFFLSMNLFSVCGTILEREAIREHNSLRRMIYSLIERKFAQQVAARQMAEAIAEGLKEFSLSYENREPESESVRRIVLRLAELSPCH